MNIKTCVQVFKNSLITDLEYRSNYWITIFSCFVTIVMDLAILQQVFNDRPVVGSLSKELLVPFVIVGIFLRQVVSDWNFGQELVSEIREGGFRRYLIQPLHFPSYFFSKLVGQKLINWFLFLSTLIVLKYFLNFKIFTWPSAPWAFLAIGFMIVLTWQIYLAIVLIGFWLNESSFLMIAFNIGIGVFSGSMLPLDWFPLLVQKAIHWTPFPLLGDVPLRLSLGTFPLEAVPNALGLSLFWVLFMTLVNHLLWVRGTKHYEAFGG